jgi:hypothetical protein
MVARLTVYTRKERGGGEGTQKYGKMLWVNYGRSSSWGGYEFDQKDYGCRVAPLAQFHLLQNVNALMEATPGHEQPQSRGEKII